MNTNNMKRMLMSVMLVSSMTLSSGAIVAQAYNGTPAIAERTMTNEQLVAATTPILQSYTKDASDKTWVMTKDSKFVIVANEANLKNNRLAEIVKLVNSEFMAKKIISSDAQAMLYNQDGAPTDITIDIKPVSEITDKTTSKEAYKITIDDTGIHLTGASETAVLYGLRTIEQITSVNGALAYGEIVDYPNVAERRIHVDMARKYISKDWFIRQIREMSYFKMNAIQMHFSENLGFRIECETDPSIVSEQHLTKADVREILAEAKKYGVKVIPSFDSPGHVDQILRAHPEYGQKDKYGNNYKSGLDVTNPEAIKYIYSLYDEYMELFKGCTDFHIGGDEYMEFDRAPFTTQYKEVLDNYARENIDPNATWKDVIAKYINDLAEHVHEKGFTPRIWNDGIYYGENSWGQNKQMIKMHKYIGIDFWSQMSWNYSIAKLQTFLDKGHDTIYNVNASFFYYVLRPSMPDDGRKQHSFDNLNSDKLIFDEWTPGKFQANTIADDNPAIKGASLAIWCDKADVCDEDTITEDIANEMRALATKAWNTKSNSIISHNQFKANYAKLGHVAAFEKGSTLPDSGSILPADSLGKVTIKYVDQDGKDIKSPVTRYGNIGDEYNFTAEKIYGYRLVSDKDSATGTYSKKGDTFTFTYEIYTDKTDLKDALDNALDENEYIGATLGEYKAALDEAQKLYDDKNALQQDVDAILTTLNNAKKKAIKRAYYPLWVEVENPMADNGYASGYAEYLEAVKNGKKVLYGEEVTDEAVKTAYDELVAARNGLMKRDGNVPSVQASDGYWSLGVSPSDKYSYDKMFDGNRDTFAWFNDAQKVGKHITFTFANKVNMSGIKISAPERPGSDIIKNADIMVSEDKENWTTVGNLKMDANNLEQTFTFDKQPVKYVKLEMKEASDSWYKIAEVQFTYEQVAENTELKDLLTEAYNQDLTDKTSDSVDTFLEALVEAQKAYAKEDLNNEEVMNALRTAMKNLKVAPKVNKAELEETVTKAEAISEETLNKAVKKARDAFAKALEEAKAVVKNKDASQEEVNEAAKKLEDAIKGLDVLKGDTTALDAKLAEIKKLDEKKYTADSWAALMNVVAEAKGLDAENATQVEVDEVVAKLTKAVDALEEKVVIEPEKPTVPEKPETKPEIKPETKPEVKPEEKPTTKPEDKKDDTVKTGDPTSLFGLVSAMALSLAGYVSVKKKKD
ncbi:family 20 glycosylhydrolase [Catenibacterium mitsuokai]|uniref:family 20 glycosylhydrolase n=1 Tax=Catenibacterium mitsuokai TaxID=100886 RepID=UPI0002F80895|nr:family 20 glycosylhydrolase [Catenibacterium mitsuokai]UWO53673.1 family 20 glycosylhydrolase [Catenibacterium mitsuokai]